MKFCVLFILSITIGATIALDLTDITNSNNSLTEAIELVTDVKNSVEDFPLLGKALGTILGALIIILGGLSLVVLLFDVTGVLYGLITGDIDSVVSGLTKLVSGAVSTLGDVVG